MFEAEFDKLYRLQLAQAKGQRREMLERDLTGTKVMLEVLYPELGSLDGIILEHEMVGLFGVKIYGDVFISRLQMVLEEEHFLTHAENVSRKRFAFERARARSVAALGYTYYPYSRDELEKQPEQCMRDFRQFMNLRTGNEAHEYRNLTVYEREALRAAFALTKPFGLAELSHKLKLERHACSRIARSLVLKNYLNKIGGGINRFHALEISDRGRELLLYGASSTKIGGMEVFSRELGTKST